MQRTGKLHRLAVFEAAARLGSFSAAAVELGIAQPAVTRHLRALESTLGHDLFVRGPNRSSLSDSGHLLHLAVASGFATIEDGIAAVGSAADAFVLACGPGIAQHLLPTFDGLDDVLGGAELHLSTYDNEKDLKMSSVDAAIRVGNGVWPGLESIFLCPENVIPVASPDLARQLELDQSSQAHDLLAVPRVYMDEGDRTWLSWTRWFKANGVTPPPPSRRIVFNNYPLVLRQALDGRGVALGWRVLVDQHIEAGHLHAVGPQVNVGNAFYLTWATGPRSDRAKLVGHALRDLMPPSG